MPTNMNKNAQFFSFMNETFELFESYVKMNQKIISRFQILKEVGKSFELDFMSKGNDITDTNSYENDSLPENVSASFNDNQIENNVDSYNYEQQNGMSSNSNQFCSDTEANDNTSSHENRFVYNDDNNLTNTFYEEDFDETEPIYSDTEDFFPAPAQNNMTSNEYDNYTNKKLKHEPREAQNTTIYSNTSQMSQGNDVKPNSDVKTFQFFCSECGKGFMKPGELKSHSRVHSDERPYPCHTCHMSFKQLSHLRRHERIHTGEKPFACNLCDKSYTRSDRLKDHQKVHRNENFNVYTCRLCNKEFNKPSYLKEHQKICATLNSSSHI